MYKCLFCGLEIEDWHDWQEHLLSHYEKEK